jgi:D-tyrosyl-tRNA(Tyr) deacylase
VTVDEEVVGEIGPGYVILLGATHGDGPDETKRLAEKTAEPLVAQFVEQLRGLGVKKVATGVFGAKMLVQIENDGPVTIILDTDFL